MKRVSQLKAKRIAAIPGGAWGERKSQISGTAKKRRARLAKNADAEDIREKKRLRRLLGKAKDLHEVNCQAMIQQHFRWTA